MKNIQFIAKDGCNDNLFNYPCVDSNNQYLKDKKITIFDNYGLIESQWFEKLGGNVIVNPDNQGTSYSNVGIVAPIIPSNDSEKAYYDILDYYIQTLQLLIHKQKGSEGYKHIVVILPKDSDQCGTSYMHMAYYAVYGLIKGQGELNAQYGLFINGIIINSNNSALLEHWTTFLSSDNACNIVGQVFSI